MYLKLLITLFLHLSYLVVHLECEYFTASSHLKDLIRFELQLQQGFKAYLTKEENRIAQLKDFYTRKKKVFLERNDKIYMNKATSRLKMHTQEVLRRYHFTKAAPSEWSELNGLMRKQEDLLRLLSGRSLPCERDIRGAQEAIIRLQDTFSLSTKQIANGIVEKSSPETKLGLLDMFDLGVVASNKHLPSISMSWMVEALQHVDVSHLILKDHIVNSIHQTFNQMQNQNDENECMYILENVDNSTQGTWNIWKNTCNHTNVKKQIRGLDLKRRKKKIKYTKFYYTRSEDVYERRLLEIEKAKSLCRGEVDQILHRLHNPAFSAIGHGDYRTSESAWLTEDDTSLYKTIDRRIGAFTGLDLSTAEPLQVANYGIGGHYEPHFDFSNSVNLRPPPWKNRTDLTRRSTFPYKEKINGERIATVLFYMSDVHIGGSTVFTNVGLQVKPSKGDALFWYNLNHDGSGDYDTRHSACPVLIGEKWVSNKWIHERGQEFRRPCNLVPVDD